jgi:hypothetical protein
MTAKGAITITLDPEFENAEERTVSGSKLLRLIEDIHDIVRTRIKEPKEATIAEVAEPDEDGVYDSHVLWFVRVQALGTSCSIAPITDIIVFASTPELAKEKVWGDWPRSAYRIVDVFPQSDVVEL